MDKDLRMLPTDIARSMNNIGYREACLIVDTTLDEMDDGIPVDTWRLIDSGFGYVNGRLVKETDQGRSNNDLDIMPPEGIPTTNPAADHFHLTISYHTPKPAGSMATVTKTYRGKQVFDYAPYVLEGGGAESMIHTESFRSRRAAALRGMAKKVGTTFSKAQLNAAIDRGLQAGLSRVGVDIVRTLSSL